MFRFFPLPFPPSLVELVSIGLVSISTGSVSVTVPGGWLLLAELPWIPVCPAQGLWLKARCSPWNHRPLWQAPSPSSSIGDEFNQVQGPYLENIGACTVSTEKTRLRAIMSPN